ncbi:hypothetical protein NP233_g934 [Leucocoprinus birnbaumii]|uniref:Uncharacterized protein n=1 Tax=Leucocoprinus birnbaumii TaxID=56174 RepID=A0AAD5Z001_9AGAR|nr:hypothetical protein NP233_g934 [Leucocoprinus birnbaumii]
MAESFVTLCLVIDDIVYVIMDFCGPSTMCALMSVSTSMKHSVRTVLSHQISKLVAKFVDEGIEAFWRTLDESESLICGSVALAALAPHVVKPGWQPADLNILSPMIPAHKMMDCLEREMGYKRISNGAGQSDYAASVFMFYVFGKEDKRITVSQSVSGTALFPLVDAPATHQMNSISRTHLYCFYPTLLEKGVSTHTFELPTHAELKRYSKFDLDFKVRAPYSTDGECLVGCFGRWRRARALCGVGRLGWGGVELESEEWMTEAERDQRTTDNHLDFCNTHVRWQLKKFCSWPGCRR